MGLIAELFLAKKNDTLIQFLFSFAEENSSPRMIPDFWLYGDMKLTYHQEALLDLPSSQDNLSIPPKAPAATREKTLLWDNGIIPYVFDCSLGNLEKLELGPLRSTMKIEFGVLLFLVVKLGNDLVKPMMPFSLSHSNSHLSTMLPPLWPLSLNFSSTLSPSGLEQNNPSLVIKSLQQ